MMPCSKQNLARIDDTGYDDHDGRLQGEFQGQLTLRAALELMQLLPFLVNEKM